LADPVRVVASAEPPIPALRTSVPGRFARTLSDAQSCENAGGGGRDRSDGSGRGSTIAELSQNTGQLSGYAYLQVPVGMLDIAARNTRSLTALNHSTSALMECSISSAVSGGLNPASRPVWLDGC
jgi:hypothetical protein